MNFISKSSGNETNFSEVEDPITFVNNIESNKITLEQAKASQEDFNEYLKLIQRGRKTEEQKNPLSNINRIFNGRNDSIKFVEEYDSMILESKRNAAEMERKRLKILTPKQMLQRLPIALAQVKAGNNSENLLNEIRQIVYSLYQSKEITKKVYNNIIKSIQI